MNELKKMAENMGADTAHCTNAEMRKVIEKISGGSGGDTAKWEDLHDLFVKTDGSLIYDLSGVPLKALYMVLSCDNGDAESSEIKSAVSYNQEGKAGIVQNSTMYSLWGGSNSVCYEPPLNGASKYWSDYARNADGDRTRSQSLIIPGATINEVKLTFSDSENDFKNSTIMGVLA